MANKVLSIKMDEKDIEKLRMYYDALIKSGFLSAKNMSLNAFYKHLLLDYLEEDISRAFATYSNYGISPQCINPEKMNNENFTLANTYNLDSEMYEIYRRCVKEALIRRVDIMKESAEQFNKVVKSDIIISEGWMYQMDCISWEDMNEKEATFWEIRAFETMDIQDKNFKENEMEGEIVMIQKSSLSEELKQKLINEIMEYNKMRKQNFSIVQGSGIID